MRNQLKRKPKNKEVISKITPLGVCIIILVIIGLLVIILFGAPVKDFYPGKPPWID